MCNFNLIFDRLSSSFGVGNFQVKKFKWATYLVEEDILRNFIAVRG